MSLMKATVNFVIFGWFLHVAWTPVQAQDSICAAVRIEIEQELTFERQAFDARMRINNGYDNLAIEDVAIEVYFQDADENPVLASSDPNNTQALFYIRLDGMENISDIGGNGRVEPETTAAINWLIIPAPGAGGQSDQGTLFYVGANLSYTLGDEPASFAVIPDSIFVKPMPNLALDYFLPGEVYGDDPFTPQLEPPIPFSLGVRVKNTGYGIARGVKIDSGQPKIVDNDQGLYVGFEIQGSQVNGQPANDGLLVDFGDIEPGTSGVGRWIMTASLSGRFVAFGASFSHRDDLGGRLTSLIDYVDTHTLIHEVLVDLPGRDGRRDFLATNQDGSITRVYETENEDTLVQDLSGSAAMTGTGDSYTVSHPPAAGFIYMRFLDPKNGTSAIAQVMRADGKLILAQNAWLSQTWDKLAGQWEYWISLFDVNPADLDYTVRYTDPAATGNQPPVIGYLSDKVVEAGNSLGFLVQAGDPNGTVPILTTGALPLGASFEPLENGFGRFLWTPQATQAGIYQVKFTASDGELTASKTISITVSTDPVANSAPIALDANFTTDEDLAIQGGLQADDPDGDALVFAIASGPQFGSAVIIDAATGQFSYTPAPNFNGSDSFSFTADDGQALSNTATVTIAVAAVNDEPGETSATIVTLVNQASEGVTPQVVDPDSGDSHTFTIETQPQHGVASVTGNQLVFTPETDYAGSDSFTFRATDSGGLFVVGTAQVTVEPPSMDLAATAILPTFTNDLLTAADVVVNNADVQTQSAVRIDLMLARCGSDQLVDSLTVDLAPGASQHHFDIDPVSISQDGPGVLYALVDAGDAVMESDERNNRVGVGILPNQAEPLTLALADNYSTTTSYCAGGDPVWSGRGLYRLAHNGLCYEVPLAGALLDFDLVRLSDDTVVTNGTVATAADGSWQITATLPAEDGEDYELHLQASDGAVTENISWQFNATTCPANGLFAPTPPFDGPDGGDALVVIDDPLADEPWLVYPGLPVPTLESGTAGGITGTGASTMLVTGSPTLGALGGAVTAIDASVGQPTLDNASPLLGELLTLQATLTADDSYYGLPVTWTVTDNQTNTVEIGTTWYYFNGDSDVVITFKPPAPGDYTVTITLGPNYSDEDDTNNSASLTFTVTEPNEPPVAEDLAVATDEDTPVSGTLPASDGGGDPLTFAITANGSLGTAVITDAATGAFSYTPTDNAFGEDSFTFQADDGNALSNIATVTVTITPVNDVPIAQDGSLATDEDEPASGTLTATDVEGDPLSYAIAAQGTLGVAVVDDPATGAYTYTPNAGASGSDSFTFTASDGSATSAPATITVTIQPDTSLPVASDQTLSTPEDTLLTGQLVATQGGGSSLTYTIVAPAGSGTATVTDAATGAFSYTPDPDFNGGDSFTFLANNGIGDSNVATVTIAVDPVNDAPVATGASLTTIADSPVSGNLTASDVDGDPLTFSITQQGTLGNAVLDNASTGAFTYTPNPGVSGSDAFTFRASDGQAFAEAVVTVQIDPANVAPVVANPIADQTATAGSPFSFTVPADTFSDPGDSLTYSASLDDDSPLPAWLTFDATGRSFDGTPTVTDGGAITIKVSATDSAGASAADEFLLTVLVPESEIHGIAFIDENANGQADAGEAGQEGRTVFLDLDRNGLLDGGEPSTVTDTQGDFAFTDLDPGLYTVAVETRAGWTRSFDATAWFGTAFESATGTDPSQVLAADFDGDGETDLVLTDESTATVSVFFNSGDGSFAAPVDYLVDLGPLTAAAGDVDNDGDTDIVTANAGADSVSLLRNQGDGTFAAAVSYSVGTGPVAVVMSDIDGDGLLDIVTANEAGGSLSLLHNQDGSFTALADQVLGGKPSAVAAALLDGDTLPDLAVTDGVGDRISVLIGQGTTFASPVDYAVASAPADLLAVDLDGDGHQDLVTGGDGNLSVLLNQGDGTFAATVDYATGAPVADLATSDVDGDGAADVLAALGTIEEFLLFTGNGDGGLAAPIAFPTSDMPRSIAVADLDGDGDEDLAAAFSQSLPGIAVLVNDRILTFAVEAGDIVEGLAFGYLRDGAPFMVDTLLDTPDADPGDGFALDGSGQTSLRAAIMEANALPGPDAIVLAEGTYTLTLAGTLEDGAATGDLDILDDLTLTGAGADLTLLDSGGLDRLLEVTSGAVLTLSGVTLGGGDTGDQGAEPNGGALLNRGTTTLVDCELAGNIAFGQGGAIWNGGTLNITNSTLAENQADDGGALYSSGTATLVNATIADNQASGEAGGVYNSGDLDLIHVTISGNEADLAGGIRSIAGTVSVKSSIIAANGATTAEPDADGSFTSGGHNLIGDAGSASGFTHGTGGDQVGDDVTPLDPVLGPLDDNGGGTRTLALEDGSPAVDSGDDSGAPSTDQRGIARPQDGDEDGTASVDIGAFEREVYSFGLISPNGGEEITIGQWVPIQWHHANLGGTVTIDISRDGGATWEFLTGSNNNGAKTWIVDGPPSDQVRLRITHDGDPSLTDSSDADLTILTPVLSVSSPNGGETFTIGATLSIEWSLTDITGGVLIELSRDGGTNWETLFGNTGNDGTQDWVVSGPATEQTLIRVTSKKDGSFLDTSDAPFTIAPPPMTVLYPNGGETLTIGEIEWFSWHDGGIGGNAIIEISRDGGATWELLYTTNNTGARNWNVKGPPTSQALLRATSSIDASVTDTSDAPFTILTPSVTVLSPNGGESLVIGSTVAIEWSLTDITGGAVIELSRDGGATWETLVANASNDGTQNWVVSGPPTAQGLIRISSKKDTTFFDVSDAVFTIPTPSVSLISPNGGETLITGEYFPLEWTVTDITGGVDIDISRDGGTSWEVLYDNASNDGFQNWRVAGTPSAQVLLRVASHRDPGYSDVSDAVNAIPTPSMSLLSPNGAEALIIGKSYLLQWSLFNIAGSVKIEISRDAGASWEVIYANASNDGNNNWTVTGPPSDQVLLRASSNWDPTYTDTSDAFNQIPVPSMTLLSPNGAEAMIIGTQYDLAWSLPNIGGGVHVELSRDAGATWETLYISATNDGANSWPVTGPPSDQVLVRTTSNVDPSLTDTSDAVNTIPAPSMTLLSPTGSEVLLIGNNANLQWSLPNISSSVLIELSRDDGTSWETLWNNASNDGNQAWAVSGPVTEQARLRITSNVDASYTATSGVFAIR